jgi:hypothetical protein
MVTCVGLDGDGLSSSVQVNNTHKSGIVSSRHQAADNGKLRQRKKIRRKKKVVPLKE